jgi:hypothetical protein
MYLGWKKLHFGGIFVGDAVARRIIERRRRCEDNIKIDFRKISYETEM